MIESENLSMLIKADPKEEKILFRLSIIEELLNNFHRSDIIYCHWKSNEHLGASMSGDTDLDILFDPLQRAQLERILEGLGFKRFESIKQKQYKDIEDFIGLDLPTGRIVHVHAHFRLTMGETYLKGYQLNLDDKILNTRVYDEFFGIYRSDPAYELILLFCREALKIMHRDIMMMYLRNRINYGGNIINEYNWLRQRVSEVQLEAVLQTIFDNPRPVSEVVTGDFNRKQLLKLAGILKREFRNNRLYSPSSALFLRWYREAVVRISRKLSTITGSPVVAQRVNPRGGIVVALVGADGSGKSTVTAKLEATFKEKLDVFKIYFGRGDGKKSFVRKLLGLAKQAALPANHIHKPTAHKPAGAERKTGMVADMYRCVEALIVANEKRNNLKRMQLAKKRGMLVICDRFPQNQIMGYNDGPLLYYLKNSNNFFFRLASKIESDIYAMIEKNPPDLLFKLIASPEIVENRKPGETSLEKLKAKIAGIETLKYWDKCKTLTIDAAQPLEKVLLQVKEELWKAML